jgi:glycopeptide antibiotics resistance protein
VAKLARPLLAVYAVLLAVALLSPTSTVQSNLVFDTVNFLGRLGVPPTLGSYPHMEVVMNALIVAPVSFLGCLAFPRSRWQDWTAYAFLGATAVELVQGLLLPHRQASLSDIVANTAGGALGALLIAYGRWVIGTSRRQREPSA